MPGSAPPAIVTSIFARDFGLSPCDTGDSVVTPLSVVNVLPGTTIISPYTSPQMQTGAIDYPNRVPLQMAFGGDVEDLPSAGLRRVGSHVRSPSMPASLEVPLATTSDRPHSTVDQVRYDNGGLLTVFDAESVGSDYAPSESDQQHLDLVENALSASWGEERGVGDGDGGLDVWDAEEIDDTNEISSPVRIDAYETESLFSVPVTQHEDEYDYVHNEHRQQTEPTLPPTNLPALPPLQTQTSDTAITPSSQQSVQSNSATLMADKQQQQQSSAFKVKGVRHVLSYGADFDKTAATLLSSIKTDIAKKAAVAGSAANIAAAIELHQQKQQQQPVPRRHEAEEATGSLSAERHTSRLSGFFGFGPRTHKTQQSPVATLAQQQQQQPQHMTLGAAGSAAGLRVVTDFQSLRGTGPAVLAAATTDPSSAEGKKSASPSTLPRRWRVPFRQRTNAAGVVSGEHSQQLSGESPLSVPMVDRGHESEASASVTPKTEGYSSQRTFRRSRYRAGTTSDIESPLTAAALLSTMDRPYSMVESSTGSSSAGGGGGLTPALVATTTTTTTTTNRPQPLSLLPPGAPQTAPKTISGCGDERQRRGQAHFMQNSSMSPTSPLFHDGHRRHSGAISNAEYSTSSTVTFSPVFVRREQDSEFTQVDISRLMSGAAIAERLVSSLSGSGSLSSAALAGDYQFAVQSADGSQWVLESDNELWTHCIRARTESPAAFVLCDSDSHQNQTTGQHHRVRFQPTLSLGEGDAASSSGSESEICSAVPFFGRHEPPVPPFARAGGYDTAGSVSPSSFVTAASNSPQVAITTSGIGQPAIDNNDEYVDDDDDDDVILADRIRNVSADTSSSLSRADSWTLMFVNKEFVVPKPSLPLSHHDLATATAPPPYYLPPFQPLAASGVDAPVVLDATSDDDNDDDELWGGAAPATGGGGDYYDDDDPVAAAMRADLAERQAAEQSDDDNRSIASSTRTLPSTMRFTRGMRATLLERRPSRNTHGRPTADMIGEQLDEYFPDHDLDRPIVQSVPMDEGLLPSHEFHIILEDDDGTAVSYQHGSGRGRRHLAKEPEEEEEGGSAPPGVGRRKSVRMLVQETRHHRHHQRRPRSRAVVVDKPAKPPRPVVRRQSTKLWGCIPEEIRPRDERGSIVLAAAAVQGGGAPRGNDEIVRRALSLLRKPEPNPQAEKDIVEAAIKCGDSSTVGSTRAHFAYERARLQQQQEETIAVDGSGGSGGAGSVNDAARALFAKYGIATAGIKIQWIKGKLIGKGSFGHVYVAINAATGEVIAVKQIRLPASLCAAATDEAAAAPVGGGSRKRRGGRAAGLLEEAIRMMYTEVELLRDLDHENVVQLLGFEVAGGVMSMFLEYVPGGTVQSLVQQHGPLPESVVHSFLRQIVAGLGYLHESGILHRDIKGANILVDETGTCKISDFGVSRKVDCTGLVAAAAMAAGDSGGGGMRKRSSIKGSGKILGTVPFMAPEVARSSLYTAAADIWSLGCVVVQ
ncbi:ATP binding, partial [Coemansia aciculifera]